MNSQPYTVINASAGSGKTYALVQKIIIICLSQPHRHDAIQHILALTFTNKAANEMKKRLIEWLESFTKEDYAQNQDLINIQNKLKELGLSIHIDELHQRAKGVLNYILHHYSTLNISTIDKFNSRLVRSFSYELGLPHQFNLEIQSEPYLIEAVDKLLEEIGNDKQISDAFMDLVNYNFENEEKTNISQTLYNKAKTYISDIHYTELKKNENFDWKAYEQTKQELRNQISEHKKEAKKLAQNALSIIKDRGLENGDFAGGGNKSLQYFFDSYLKNEVPKLYATTEEEEKKVSSYEKGASSAGKLKQHLIEEILGTLLQYRREIIRHYIQQVKKEKILKELLPFKFNKEIQNQLNIIENENDLVLLSKFNILINENLRNEPSAFLYEKIGTRFKHFFIDEFQDTSKMQWENMFPLKENNTSQESNSFTIVGDPKQSIYRFRGGESEIMLNILNHKEPSNVPPHIENLGNNWRSAKNIVEFNNELYHFIGQKLEPEHQKLFAEDGKQNAVKNFPGRVRVNLTDYDPKSAVFFENSARQMHQDIQKCVDLGFSLSDITIICRKGSEIKEYSKLLSQKEIHYNGVSQKIKTISEKGLILGISYTLKALIEFLHWQLEPKDTQHLVKFIYHLNALGRIQIEDFTKEIQEILSEESLLSALERRYSLNLTPKLNLNLYNYVEYFLREFSVEGKETDFLLNFLENLYAFSQNIGANTKDFLQYWEEEAKNISVQASDNIDAIKLMTIHAAKGLEFPVVLLPIQSANKDYSFNEWFSLDDNDGALQSINISYFSKEFIPYDEDIKVFNQINQYKNKIDRLCVLYVATTRPVEHLYLYLQRPSGKGESTEILSFIENKVGNMEENEFDLYPNTDENWKKVNKKKEKSYRSIPIQSLSRTAKNLDNITIATPSKNYQNTVDKVRAGIFTHEILSKIKTKNDINKVLNTYLLEGTITKEEKVDIQQRIQSITENPQYAPYFSEGVQVISERDILFQNSTYRPDRLVKMPEGWVIIDFKTGEENEKHLTQIEVYRNILEQLGKKVIKTEIIYIL